MATLKVDYLKNIVKKPWGYEYVIYSDKNKIAITYLNINFKKQTSLHCHPKKKTGFIILKGRAKVQIGIYKKNSKIFGPNSRLVFRPGLFHSLKSVSKKGLIALEFEAPFLKEDLVRLNDKYGRASKGYEGKKSFKTMINLTKFKKPKKNEKLIYKLNNTVITIENVTKIKKLLNYKDDSTSAILDGALVDTKGQNVISYGEVIKTNTIGILAKTFKLKNPMTILKVEKKL